MCRVKYCFDYDSPQVRLLSRTFGFLRVVLRGRTIFTSDMRIFHASGSGCWEIAFRARVSWVCKVVGYGYGQEESDLNRISCALKIVMIHNNEQSQLPLNFINKAEAVCLCM